MANVNSQTTVWYKQRQPWIVIAAAGAVMLFIGWLIPLPSPYQTPLPQSLRLSGYQFIDPLLVCNVNNSHVFPEDQSLSNAVEAIITPHITAGDISKISVYFNDLTNGKWSSINADQMFFPSSLGKVPIMMAYYELADTDPSILNQTITYSGGPNLNQMQDIPPPQSIVPGQTYTIEQLIEYMVKYSDNNAAQLLYDAVNQSDLNNIYQGLGIPTITQVTTANADAVTALQISQLFKVLYNATYISRDASERALALMSQASFKQGLVAGVPPTTTVSHKFGLVGIYQGNTAISHELHDCGIVYAKDPYVICVMSEGSGSLQTLENIIANISRVVYQNVQEGS